jgi:hypothetical protein
MLTKNLMELLAFPAHRPQRGGDTVNVCCVAKLCCTATKLAL